jgi:hypothetical protein
VVSLVHVERRDRIDASLVCYPIMLNLYRRVINSLVDLGKMQNNLTETRAESPSDEIFDTMKY